MTPARTRAPPDRQVSNHGRSQCNYRSSAYDDTAQRENRDLRNTLGGNLVRWRKCTLDRFRQQKVLSLYTAAEVSPIEPCAPSKSVIWRDRRNADRGQRRRCHSCGIAHAARIAADAKVCRTGRNTIDG